MTLMMGEKVDVIDETARQPFFDVGVASVITFMATQNNLRVRVFVPAGWRIYTTRRF